MRRAQKISATSRPRLRQRGVAIIIALLVTALATGLAVATISEVSLAVTQLASRRDYAQAKLLADGGVDYARAILAEDARRTSYDHNEEPWTTPLPAFDTGLGYLAGQIEDRQGCLNLNNLVTQGKVNLDAVSSYQNLLNQLDLSDELALNTALWIAPPAKTVEAAADDLGAATLERWYAEQKPPYVPALADLADFSELAKIKGYDAEAMKTLRPYVCVLPGRTALNVNTAKPEVLAAVLDNMSLAEAQRIAEERNVAPFRDLTDFSVRARMDENTVKKKNLTVSTEYFMAEANVHTGKATVRMRVLLHRQQKNKWPELVWRELR